MVPEENTAPMLAAASRSLSALLEEGVPEMDTVNRLHSPAGIDEGLQLDLAHLSLEDVDAVDGGLLSSAGSAVPLSESTALDLGIGHDDRSHSDVVHGAEVLQTEIDPQVPDEVEQMSIASSHSEMQPATSPADVESFPSEALPLAVEANDLSVEHDMQHMHVDSSQAAGESEGGQCASDTVNREISTDVQDEYVPQLPGEEIQPSSGEFLPAVHDSRL